MMKMETKEIKFYEDILLGVKDESGHVWLAVKKTCMDIGLSEGQADRQIKNLQNDNVFNGSIKSLNVKFDGQIRKIVCISEKVVTLWLAKISLTPTMQKKKPDAYNKLLKYQLEAANVLYKAFYETEDQKATFNDSMGLEGKILSLERKLEMTVVQLNNVEESLDIQTEQLSVVMDNMTLTTVQQGKLQRAVKDRINELLGGAHSKEYKRNSKLYFINLWNGLKERFCCGSRWQDLNPRHFNEALDFVSEWEYLEV